MEIFFSNSKLQKILSDTRHAVREFGPQVGRKCRERLQELRAARCLMDMKHFPGARFHMRVGGRMHGVFSVDVSFRDRLVFTPAHDPVPTLPDGGVDLKAVTAITILGVDNPHD